MPVRHIEMLGAARLKTSGFPHRLGGGSQAPLFPESGAVLNQGRLNHFETKEPLSKPGRFALDPGIMRPDKGAGFDVQRDCLGGANRIDEFYFVAAGLQDRKSTRLNSS